MTYDEFRAYCEAEGLEVTEETLGKLKIYAARLKEWNEKMNLTSIVEEEEVIEKHFLDSALPLFAFGFAGKNVADMGSGAGFPGMVLALLCPECQVTLIDATEKKFQFLKTIKEELGIQNVSFHIGRVEDMHKQKETFDLVISRGFASLPILMEVGTPLLKIKGQLIAMKGPKAEEELTLARSAIKTLGLQYLKADRRVLPVSGERVNLLFLKALPTPQKFPRPWAAIKHKPL